MGKGKYSGVGWDCVVVPWLKSWREVNECNEALDLHIRISI